MNKILLIIIIVVLVVFFGTFPLSILSKIFQFIGNAVEWLARILNIFGWNGIV